jgi:hypothetical protein
VGSPGGRVVFAWRNRGARGTVLLKTRSEGKRYVHRYLWEVVLRQFEHAKAQKTGSFHDLSLP